MLRTIPLIAVLFFLGASAFAQQPAENLRTINTSGDAVVYVTPDQVIVSLGVETFNAQLDQARAVNAQACSTLLRAIKELGVDEKDIQTDVMQVEIDYDDGRRGAARQIDGYFCRRGYQVTLKDTKLFEKLIDTAIQNGANHLMGFEFRTSELRKHRDEARQMAIKAAREKATALAGELGARVGKPRTISESGGGYYGYQSSWWGWNGGGYAQMAQNASVDRSGGVAEGGETMPLGQISIRAQVNVTFDLNVN